MLYGYKVIDGVVHISYMGGHTAAEEALAKAGGWTFYWATTRTAGKVGHALAAKAAKA